ncbi:MAG: ABC transporter ATP-binding protein [Anaerolineae bacterium]|nr:MAG: ABC transporter ATP-binding protein [Anaerolineae bacterium]
MTEPSTDVLLRAERVTKTYQMGSVEVDALRAVDFEVRRGEFVAIMGPSGSGKSTLLHLLGGLDQPSEGEITLAGQPLSQLTDDEITTVRRRKVGFIFQFYNLLPTLSAQENIALPLVIDGENVGLHTARLNTLIDLVGLTDRGDHRPDQLSGGQQQRVAIARAFINQPEIVLADEPTGNLDSRTGTAILELLQRTCREMQATILMVTHDARAASYADRVVFLKDGQVVHHLGENGKGNSVEAIMDVMAGLEL